MRDFIEDTWYIWLILMGLIGLVLLLVSTEATGQKQRDYCIQQGLIPAKVEGTTYCADLRTLQPVRI